MDDLYSHRCGVCGGFHNELEQEVSFSKEVLARMLREIYDGLNVRDEIQRDAFMETLRLFNEATVKGLEESGYVAGDRLFYEQLRTNNEVFSAFRTHRMQNDLAARMMDDGGKLKPFDKWVRDVEDITDHYVMRWLRTEYDTAVLRAHQAADWKRFEADSDVLPNLRWMPTTSPDPDIYHRQYWEAKLTLPVGHPFWKSHRPGDRWNCKCSLEATDEPATAGAVADFKPVPQQPGLDNNPADDGKLFNDSHPYFPDKCKNCAFFKPKITNRLGSFFTNKAKDCYHCKQAKESFEKSLRLGIYKKNRTEYYRLLKDPNYKDISFSKKTGGLKATHIGHVTHDSPKAERFFEGLTSSDLERECMDQLVKMGHRVIFCDESKKRKGQQLPALDMMLDGELMDIRSVTGHGWYSNIFVSKNDQLRRFNRREDKQDKADSLCLYFHDPNLFQEEKMKRSINFFRYFRDQSGNLIEKDLKHIFCVIKGKYKIVGYDI